MVELHKSKDLELLIKSPRKQRCIDIVILNLDNILTARENKITWDEISDSLNIHRSTLINAVKKILLERDKTEKKSSFISNNKKQDLLIKNTREVVKENTDKKNNAGIKMIGRANLNNFNL